MSPEPFVFAKHPPHDERVNRAQCLTKPEGIETAVVAHPPRKSGANPLGYFLQIKIAPTMPSPPAHHEPHSLASVIADSGNEADEAHVVAADRYSRPECVAEKVE